MFPSGGGASVSPPQVVSSGFPGPHNTHFVLRRIDLSPQDPRTKSPFTEDTDEGL